MSHLSQTCSFCKSILPPRFCDFSLLSPHSLSLWILSFPSCLARPRLYKQFSTRRMWLRREYIHHAFLSFSKVNSQRNMKTHPGVYVFLSSGVWVCQVKSPPKSSLKVQTTSCLSLQWSENKRHFLPCVSICACSWCVLWVNEQTLSMTRELTHQSAAIRCPTPLLLLLLPTHFLPSCPAKDSQGCLSCFELPLNATWLVWSILYTPFLFLLCVSFISCIHLSLHSLLLLA